MTDIPPPAPPRRNIGRSLILPSRFCVGGVAATAGLSTRTEFGSQLVSSPAPAPIIVDPVKMAAPVAANPSTMPVAPDLAARIAAIEARLARAEANGGSVSGGTNSQVSRVVLAIAARRVIESGRSLGALQGELERQFAGDAPHLVTAIASASQQPTTLKNLTTEFTTLAPSLSGSGDKWWARISTSLSSLVTVRDAKAKADSPTALVAEAEAALTIGDVSAAVDAVGRTPNRAIAMDWIAKAKRYAAAMQAVEALEDKAFAVAAEVTPAPVMVLPEPKPAPVTDESGAI